jgi:hypothetical protein
MGKIKAPSDLRPPFATTLYHRKLRMFQPADGDVQQVLRLLVQTPDFWCNYGPWCKDGICGTDCSSWEAFFASGRSK